MTDEELRQAALEDLSYSAETGLFHWKFSGGRRSLTSAAGSFDADGYVIIKVRNKRIKAHRLAWLVVYGELPEPRLDHINSDKTDNRINNLRLASASQNVANGGRRSNNKSGYKGVTAHYGKWRATIQKNGNKMNLGTFDTKELAHAAYAKAATIHFGEYANAG